MSVDSDEAGSGAIKRQHSKFNPSETCNQVRIGKHSEKDVGSLLYGASPTE